MTTNELTDGEILVLIANLLAFFLCLLLCISVLPEALTHLYHHIRENYTPGFHKHSWKYKKLTVPFKIGNRQRKVTIPTRRCIKCGQKQYRSMMPRENGIDNNHWHNYAGEFKIQDK